MYLLDTNTVINFLDASMPAPAMAFMGAVVKNHANISVITKMEALGYSFNKAAEEKAMWAFISGCQVLGIGEDIVNRTIAVRKFKKIKLPDAVIAATAPTYGFTLLTRNLPDFNGLPGLQVINPWDV